MSIFFSFKYFYASCLTNYFISGHIHSQHSNGLLKSVESTTKKKKIIDSQS